MVPQGWWSSHVVFDGQPQLFFRLRHVLQVWFRLAFAVLSFTPSPALNASFYWSPKASDGHAC